MVILQHALQNLFQVADLKEQNQINQINSLVICQEQSGHVDYFIVTLRRQLAPLSSLILPSHVSLNQAGSLLTGQQDNITPGPRRPLPLSCLTKKNDTRGEEFIKILLRHEIDAAVMTCALG